MPRPDPKSDSSDLRTNGDDLTDDISSGKTAEKKHLMVMNMKKTKKIGIEWVYWGWLDVLPKWL